MPVKPDGLEHLVAGVYMDRSLRDFVRACGVYLEEEQAKLAPDTHVITLVCDAVRLTREMRLMTAKREDALAVLYAELSSKQQPLGKECEQVLHDNLWDLLVTL